jgi:hypothetical protein
MGTEYLIIITTVLRYNEFGDVTPSETHNKYVYSIKDKTANDSVREALSILEDRWKSEDELAKKVGVTPDENYDGERIESIEVLLNPMS